MSAEPRNAWLGLVATPKSANVCTRIPGERPPGEVIADRVRLLCAAISSMREGKAVPPEAAAWLAAGLERFLQEGGDLVTQLNLKPRRGGAHETAQAVYAARERDRVLIVSMMKTPGESPSARAETLRDYLLNGGTPPFKGAERLRKAYQDGQFKMPGRRRACQIFSVDPQRVVHFRR